MEEKFETCKNRSVDKVVYESSPCCGTVFRDGYTCYRLNIQGLTQDICKYCEFYEQREKENS
jgi:hypothetical protein